MVVRYYSLFIICLIFTVIAVITSIQIPIMGDEFIYYNTDLLQFDFLNIFSRGFFQTLSGHPPLLGWIYWLFIKVFGNTLLPLRILQIFIFNLTALYLYLHLTQLKLKQPSKLLIILLFLFNPISIGLSSFLSPDIFLCLFLLTSLYYKKNNNLYKYSLSLLCLGLIRETGILLAFIFFLFDLYQVYKDKKLISRYIKIWSPFLLFLIFFLWFFFTGLSSFEMNPVVAQRLTNTSVGPLEYLKPTGKGLYGTLVHYYGFLFYFIIISSFVYCVLPVPRFLDRYKNKSWILLLAVLSAIFIRSYMAINASDPLANYRTFNIVMASASLFFFMPSFSFLHPIKNKNLLVISLLSIYVIFLFAYGDYAPRDFLLPFVLLLIFPISTLFRSFSGTMFLLMAFVFMIPLNFVPPIRGSYFNPASLVEKRNRVKNLGLHYPKIKASLSNEKVYSNGPFCEFLNDQRYGLQQGQKTFECMKTHTKSSIIIIGDEYSFSERDNIELLNSFVKLNNYSLIYTYKTGIETYKVYKK